MITNQLSLFSELEEQAFREKADGLLNLLNMELKPKYQYLIHFYYKHKDLYILIAANKEKHVVCNIVNEKGFVPNDFSVNWRNHNHILKEIKNYNL